MSWSSASGDTQAGGSDAAPSTVLPTVPLRRFAATCRGGRLHEPPIKSGGWRSGPAAVSAHLLALALAGSLSGCFQPLYGEAAHPGLVDDLRAIDVAPIKDRLGHYLQDDLITDLNGTGQTVSPKYRLTVTVSTGTATPTVNSQTNVASSATLTGEASYTLTKVDGGAEVLKGNAQAVASYDRTIQRYADLRAARDAEIRIARALSTEISTRLASALAAKGS